MYNKILVPMALDHGVSEQTLKIAQGLASEGAEVIALHVYEAPQRSVAAYLDAEAVKDSMALAKSNLEAKTAHLPGVRAELVQGHSARTIIDYAADHDVDCIVMGSHKPGFSDYFL